MYSEPVFQSYDDVVVYISCIFGILGAVVIVAIVFFILDHCGYITSQSDIALRRKIKEHEKLLHEARMKTASWVDPKEYGNIKPRTPLPPQTVSHVETNGLANGIANQTYESLKGDDDLSYINQIFSEVEEQADHFAKSGVKRRIVYDQDEDYSQEKEDKPSLAVAYERPEKHKNEEDAKGSGIKVPMELENMDLNLKPQRRPSLMVPMDDFDINAVRREEERQKEEEEKDKFKVMVMMEKTVRPDKPVYKSQSIEYENPKIAKREREELRRQEELKREEEMKNRKSRRIAVENPKYNRIEEVPEETQKPKRRIVVEK